MKRHQQITASALPVALVVGTLMLLAVLALLSLSDIEMEMGYGHHSRMQKEAWLESAVLLYERDSTLIERLDEQHSFPLFENDPAALINLTRMQWGLYEIIKTTAQEGKYRRACLVGYQTESPKAAALYVCDNRRAFTISGKSNLKGRVYLPENGLLYGQVQSEFYSGDPLPESQIGKSDENLPGTGNGIIDSLRQLLAISLSANSADILNSYEERNSFFEPIRIYQTENLSGTTLQGNIIVYSRFVSEWLQGWFPR